MSTLYVNPPLMLPNMGKQNTRGPAEGFVRMTFDLEESLRDELKVLSAMEKRPMGELLRLWTKQGIAALQKKHGRK